MRSLAELLASLEGRSLLEVRGLMLETERFREDLRQPVDGSLVDLLSLPPGTRPVYVAHQTHVDLAPTVVAKLRSARALDGGDVSAVMLWLDTDRIGSDKAATTIVWPDVHGDGSIRLVPHRLKNLEARFVPLERQRLLEVATQLRAWIDETVPEPSRTDARARLGALVSEVVADEPATLAQTGEAMASLLLRERLSFAPPSTLVSTLAERGLLTRALEDALNVLTDIRRVFNEAVEELTEAGIDPHVRPLSEDYLPLNYSCEECGSRRRLRHHRAGADHVAVAVCSCGACRRFHLGSRTLSLAELEATGRWSPDVTLPVYLNDLVSGAVVGRSSALYGLVLGAVLERALGRRPVPMVLPEGLGEAITESATSGSLLHDYLVGA